MKARWLESWGGPLRSGRRPDPEPGDAEVLIDVEACGVGLTVLNCIRGDLADAAAGLPRIPGHELVGAVTAVGPGGDPDLIGRRVMAYFYLVCGSCSSCLAGNESMCRRLAGHVGVHVDGGYGERVVLPQRNVVPVPEGIDAVAATTIPDAIATPVHVARRAGIAPGDRVAVVGAGGGVGLHMLQVARRWGADVAGLDVAPRKLAYIESEGFAHAVDAGDLDAVRLPGSWDHGADVVIDLVGTRATLGWGLRALAPSGRLVVLTTFRDTTVELSPRELVLRQQSVIASRYASRAELMLAARLVAEGSVRPIVSRVVGPGEVDELHAMLTDGRLLGRGALRWE